MALGAHEVPVLVQLGPVQDVVVANLLIRIEMEPALATTIWADCPRPSIAPGAGRLGIRSGIAAADRCQMCISPQRWRACRRVRRSRPETSRPCGRNAI